MATNKDILYTTDVSQTGQTAPFTGSGDFSDLRRKHDFGDRVAELSPEESPFFVYLNKVSKVATTDPVFRFLENRSKIDWTSRNFVLANAPGAVTADTNVSFSVVASDLRVSPSNVVSAPGIGIDPNLLLIVPNNSLHNAKPYFLIHCFPTSFMNSYFILSYGTFE